MVEVDEVGGAVSSDATFGSAVAFAGMADGWVVTAGLVVATSNPVGIAVLCGASVVCSVITYCKDTGKYQ